MLFSKAGIMGSQPEQPFPPGPGWGSGLTYGSLQPMADGGRDRRVQGVVPQHLLHVREFERRLLLLLLQRRLLLFLFAGSKSILMFHGLSALLKQNCESFARAVQFATHRIG